MRSFHINCCKGGNRDESNTPRQDTGADPKPYGHDAGGAAIPAGRQRLFTTQATISRDIRELRLVKVLSPSGIYYYTQNSAAPADTLQLSGDSVFMRSIRSVDFAGNIVVIKTHSAMASAVCEAVDNSNRPEILGTIAGENTIFVLLKTEHFADEFCTHLRELMKKNLSR